MAELKNLLETMSTVFNKTINKTTFLDMDDDKTLKWKTLHHNQYASKKYGKRTKGENSGDEDPSNDNQIPMKNIKETNTKEESWDCSSHASSFKLFPRNRKRIKEIINEDQICPRKSERRKISKYQQGFDNYNNNIIEISSAKVIKSSTKNINSSAILDEEVFFSFGQTIALQLKELNKFNKIAAHTTMQEINNLVTTRIVKVLAQEGGNDVLK